jgi:tetratricopeptide (TPR) repeat protein
MNNEELFISISDKIRKQLEITKNNNPFSYYEILGLNETSSLEDIEKHLSRSRELLDRLKYTPQFKDEAANAMKFLEKVEETLNIPEKRSGYDLKLKEYFKVISGKKTEKFQKIVALSLADGKLSASSKKSLLGYASYMNIPEKIANLIFGHYPETNEDYSRPIAKPPELSAFIPHYLETKAFQILLDNAIPLVKELKSFHCSGCNKTVSVTHLICNCGSILRGKMICIECAMLFSTKLTECPSCGKESKLFLKLDEEDISNIYKIIKKLCIKGESCKSLRACKDLLEIKPGEKEARNMLPDLEKKAKKETDRKKAQKQMEKGIDEFKNGNFKKALKILLETEKTYPLSDEAKKAIGHSALKISEKYKKKYKKYSGIGLIFNAIGFLLLFLEVKKILHGTEIIIGPLILIGTVLIITGILSLSNKRKFKNISKKISPE